jgi:2-oxo-4-hydroxy-4-carboxy-5-ureidoimidazoline decarboxylase
MKTPLSLAELNSLDREAFIARFGGIFEHSPWVAERAYEARPFGSLEQLHASMCAAMYAATQEEKLSLIRAHPDLVGRAALAGTLTPDSTREQASAGLDRLTSEEIVLFNQLNTAYRDRFGFPFVICARENKKESILTGFQSRLKNTPEQEVDTALLEIARIARLRLEDAVADA